MLTCPICHTTLTLHSKSYLCQNRHSYDIAKEGYVNLHVVQHKKSKRAGDTLQSVQARRAFLSKGFYAPLQNKISQVLVDIVKQTPLETVLDIGCGEGYYTQVLAQSVGYVIGLDIAKAAIQMTAKTHKQPNIHWVVGTGAVLPVADGSVDLCTSFFSPLPVNEMLRVLSPKGLLLMATPAPMHLYAMRERLFDRVVAHDPAKFIHELSPAFHLLDSWQVDTQMDLDGQSLGWLIDMTPYTYKARLENKTALKALDRLSVQASFMLYLFKKHQ